MYILISYLKNILLSFDENVALSSPFVPFFPSSDDPDD